MYCLKSERKVLPDERFKGVGR